MKTTVHPDSIALTRRCGILNAVPSSSREVSRHVSKRSIERQLMTGLLVLLGIFFEVISCRGALAPATTNSPSGPDGKIGLARRFIRNPSGKAPDEVILAKDVKQKLITISFSLDNISQAAAVASGTTPVDAWLLSNNGNALSNLGPMVVQSSTGIGLPEEANPQPTIIIGFKPANFTNEPEAIVLNIDGAYQVFAIPHKVNGLSDDGQFYYDMLTSFSRDKLAAFETGRLRDITQHEQYAIATVKHSLANLGVRARWDAPRGKYVIEAGLEPARAPQATEQTD